MTGDKRSTVVFTDKQPAQVMAVALTAAEGEDALVWHYFVPVGKFSHKLYGDFEVTERDLQEMVQNFNDNIPVSGGIPIDEDGLHNPRGEGAYGWVEELEIRAGVLWGAIRWTPDGVQAIEGKQFKHASATFYLGLNPYASTSVMSAAALCTRPFFREQPELRVAASDYSFEPPTETTATTPPAEPPVQAADDADDEPSAPAVARSNTRKGGYTMTEQEAKLRYEEIHGAIPDKDWEELTGDVTTDEQWQEFTATLTETPEGDEVEQLKARVAELETALQTAQEDKDIAVRQATTELTDRVTNLERQRDEAQMREELAATELGGNARYSPAAVDLMVKARMDPTADAVQALHAHMAEHGGAMETVVMGEHKPVTAGAELTDEQWLENYSITPEMKERVRKIAATESISLREAYPKALDDRRGLSPRRSRVGTAGIAIKEV